MIDEIVTVNSLRFDRTVKRSWECRLLNNTGDRIVLAGEFTFDVDHPDLGLVKTGTTSHEYFWLDRWYNVFVAPRREGDAQQFSMIFTDITERRRALAPQTEGN